MLHSSLVILTLSETCKKCSFPTSGKHQATSPVRVNVDNIRGGPLFMSGITDTREK